MRISVIMPVYNCEKCLSDAVNSVLSQGDIDLELIAIDDASTDGSAELLKTLAEADGRIRPFFNVHNKGVAAVRNQALALARGEFLAFCDADDVVPAGAYAALLGASRECDAVIGAHADVCEVGARRVAYVGKRERRDAFTALLAVGCLWTKLIRRSFVIEHGLLFDEDLRIGEDVVFLGRLSIYSPRYRVIDRVVYYHCHRPSLSPSLIHTYTLEAFLRHIECRRRLLSVAGARAGAEDFVYLSFSRFLIDMLLRMQYSPEAEDAFRHFRDYMIKYDFSSHGADFLALVGMKYDDFLKVDAVTYFATVGETLPRERVLYEFSSGRLGLRYILRYFAAWLKFKFRKER